MMMFFKVYRIKVLLVVFVLTVISILTFATSIFDEVILYEFRENPLWITDNTPKSNMLTKSLRDEGFTFHTGRGAEADPDGICFGFFSKDEYWVINYLEDQKKLQFCVTIADVNFFRKRELDKKFRKVNDIIRSYEKQRSQQLSLE